MKKNLIIFVLTIFVGLFSLSAGRLDNPAFSTNQIVGVVTECHTNPVVKLAGATIKITRLGNPNTPVATITAGPNGDFHVGYVAAGSYKIEVRLLGYVTIEQTFGIPDSNSPQTVNLEMCTMEETTNLLNEILW